MKFVIPVIVFLLVILQAMVLFWLSPLTLHTGDAAGFWLLAILIADIAAGFVFSFASDRESK